MLKPMTGDDWFAFQGAENFEDGSAPLIHYEGEDGSTVILLDAGGLNVGFGDEQWFQLECTKALGLQIADHVIDNLSINHLTELGFKDIM